MVLRTILWGGNHVTRAMAIRQASSFAEAERQKRTIAVDQVGGLLEPLLREVRITLQAHEGTERGRLTHCWVSGGGSKMREVGGFVARQLGLYPVGARQGFDANSPRAFSIAFGLAIHPKIVRPRWRFTPSPTGLALDLKGVAEAASPQAGPSPQDRRLAIGAAVIVALLAIADFATHFMLKDQRVTQLKQELNSRYEQIFGTSASPGDELDQARYRIEALDKALSVVDGTDGTVLATLSTFVKQLPAGTVPKIRELTVDGSTLLMEAETTSFDAIEKLKLTLTSSPRSTDVSVMETRVGAAPNQVVFRLTATVKQP